MNILTGSLQCVDKKNEKKITWLLCFYLFKKGVLILTTVFCVLVEFYTTDSLNHLKNN